jgi:hypothetical protein
MACAWTLSSYARSKPAQYKDSTDKSCDGTEIPALDPKTGTLPMRHRLTRTKEGLLGVKRGSTVNGFFFRYLNVDIYLFCGLIIIVIPCFNDKP